MTGIFFGSTMGTTEAVAADIAKQLGVADADVHNVADTPAGEWVFCTPVGEAHYFIRRSWRDLAKRRLPDRHVLDLATTEQDRKSVV